MKIIESILTKNPCYTAGRTITVKGLMLHSVGCNQPSASAFVKSWNPPANGREVCVHGFIDANTGDVYKTLPWNHRGWHGGGSSNNTHIGIEMCEPACIKYTGGSTFTCSDTATARTAVKRTYDSAVELFAMLCKEFGLDPLADGVIISHKEGHARGIASNHGDPEHLWTQLGMGYTMDGFRKAVKTAMGDTTAKQPTEAASTIKEGDTVKISNGAVYYDGKKTVPAWVIAKQWIVKQCKGDRAVIDKSVDGKNAICSPINTKYLTVVAPSASQTFSSYLVKVTADALNIRKGPGTNYGINGCIQDKGVYTIVAESSGAGASVWGKLKSGAGWISLDYTKKL